MKPIVIDPEEFKYNKDILISKGLQKKPNEIKKNNKYRNHISRNNEAKIKNILKLFIMKKNKFRIEKDNFAFKHYTNIIKIKN